MTASQRDFKDLLDELQDAMTRWGEADRDEREAFSRKTQALIDINQAQRSLDAHMAAVRKAAPRESDWNQRPGLPVGPKPGEPGGEA